MAPWAAPTAAAAILLIGTGVMKGVRPDASAGALPGSVSPRWSRPIARGLGAVEIAIGLAVLIVGNRLAVAAMAALFAAFAGFTYFAIRSGASSCGCTGAVDSPPTGAHAAMNVAFASLAAVAAATSETTSGEVLVRAATDPVGVVVIAMVVVVAWLAWMVLDLGALRSFGGRQEGRMT
jgi:hypothetical protein